MKEEVYREPEYHTDYRPDDYDDDVFRPHDTGLSRGVPPYRGGGLVKSRGSDSQYSSMSSGADSSPESPKRRTPPKCPAITRSTSRSTAPPADVHYTASPIMRRSNLNLYEAEVMIAPAPPVSTSSQGVEYAQIGQVQNKAESDASDTDSTAESDTTETEGEEESRLTDTNSDTHIDMTNNASDQNNNGDPTQAPDSSLLANTPRNVHLYRNPNVDCVVYDVQ